MEKEINCKQIEIISKKSLSGNVTIIKRTKIFNNSVYQNKNSETN